MSSAFQLLSRGGSHFDKQKFKREHDMFAKKPTASSSSTKAKGKQPEDTPAKALPSELDFFASGSSSQPTSTTTTSQPKRKRQQQPSPSPDPTPSTSTIAPPKQKITLTGPKPLPTSFTSFDDLIPTSHAYLRRHLHDQGVHHLWGVQGAVAGGFLAKEDRDLMVVAPTGSGKTLSYLLPLFLKLDRPCRTDFKLFKSGDKPSPGQQGIRSLIMLPTHELALQTQNEIAKLIKETAWRCILLDKATEKAVAVASPGEAEEVDEVAGPTLGIDLLVATPERLHSMVSQKRLDLSETRFLIMDEADRLIGPDFYEQVAPIVTACSHEKVQKALLSATMEAGPEALAKLWLRDEGLRIVVGVKDAATSTVSQHLQFCGSESGKLMALRNDIAAGKITPPTLIFVQSIERANDLFKELVMDGLQVGVIHSDRSKAKREEVVREFREGKIWVLVVTELMARGLDFKGVEVVVNYDFPQTVQSYVHRIGRTGRAGRRGTAITYFTLEDGPVLRTIANLMKASGCAVDPWMLDLPKPSKNLKKQRRDKPVLRKSIGQKGKNPGKQAALNRVQMLEASRKRSQVQQGKKGEQAGPVEVDMEE